MACAALSTPRPDDTVALAGSADGELSPRAWCGSTGQRGRRRTMPQTLTHGVDVLTVFDEISGVRVPQRVRANTSSQELPAQLLNLVADV